MLGKLGSFLTGAVKAVTTVVVTATTAVTTVVPVPVVVAGVLAVVGGTTTALITTLTGGAITTIPIPNPLVIVTTHSGNVTRKVIVPIGGVPIPIDVDGKPILGLLEPDVDVSVGLVALDELPGNPLVPNVVVRRDPLAVLAHRPAPPLRIDAKIELLNAADALKTLATIHYGFATPPGAVMPPVVSAKLVGPISGGFIDPLQAKLETPGYGGPLDFHVNLVAKDLDADFKLGFDVTPESIFFEEQSTPTGLKAVYKHSAAVGDVQLDARATLHDLKAGTTQRIDANVERLPQALTVSQQSTDTGTAIAFDSSSVLSKPDVRAGYRGTDAQGVVESDTTLRVAGLPAHLRGTIATTTGADGTDIDGVDFRAVDAAGNVTPSERIDALDFTARNWIGDPGTLPEPDLGPDQYVAMASRRIDATHTRYRAAGRLEGIRSLTYTREGALRDGVDAVTDLGDGAKPLRTLIDLDSRGPGQDVGAARLRLDSTLTPLPARIHANYNPSDGGADPTTLHYDSSSPLDVEADATIATGAADACGQAGVTCLRAAVDKVPTTMDITLPGQDGTDFGLGNDAPASARPDVRAVVDRTGEDAESRTYAEIGLTGIPGQVRGRVDASTSGTLRAGEFHACDWDYAAGSCRDEQGAIGRVTFAVRDRPSRAGLPGRPDTVPDFVTLVARDKTLAVNGDERFEAAGRIDEVRNVAFRQRDEDDDGEGDGTLGVQVEATPPVTPSQPATPFDIVVDTAGRAADPAHPQVDIGATRAELGVHVDALPTSFSACVRQAADGAPPAADKLPPDALLAACDRTDVIGRQSGELDTTPLSAVYRASSATKVTAHLSAQAPDLKDLDNGTPRAHTTVFDSTIDKIPNQVRADMIPGVDGSTTPGATGRKLELQYTATGAHGAPATISSVLLKKLELRRSTDTCADPRPHRQATCMRARFLEVPSSMYASFDPDETKGDLEFRSSPPQSGHGKLSINPLHLDTVADVKAPATAAPLVLDAKILGLTPRLSGRIKRVQAAGTTDRELAELRLSACLDADGKDQCDGSGPFGDGIELLSFSATNSLIGQGIPDEPAGPAGVDGDVAFLANHDHFRAHGSMTDLREVLMSRFSPQDDTLIPSTRIRLGFGADDPTSALRAYIDLQGAKGRQLADLVVKQPPRAFTACLRDPVEPGQQDAESSVWCEGQDPARSAIQLGVEQPASGSKPDVSLRRLLITGPDGRSPLTGSATIDNLGARIDVLAAREPREQGFGRLSCTDGADNDQNGRADQNDPGCQAPDSPDVSVTGEDADGTVGDVAGRITVALQNYLNTPEDRLGPPAGATNFPWAPQPGAVDPGDNPANHVSADATDPGGENVVRAIADSGGRFLLQASVPHVRSLGVSPGPCYTDQRVRPAADFPAPPSYRCVRVKAAGGEPLGLAFRSQDGAADPNILAVEEGHLTQMPAGEKGFEATLATVPAQLAQKPLCGADVAPPCQPPLISVENDRSGAQTPAATSLQARFAVGSTGLMDATTKVEPRDEASSRLDYEQPPSAWPAAARGARIKLGSSYGGKTALRAGLNLALPRYLDLYPPLTWACRSMDPNAGPSDCNDATVSTHANAGFDSSDLAFKLVGAEDHHDGAGLPYLGRVSLLVNPFVVSGSQIVLTGTPAPDGKNAFGASATGASSVSPETINSLPTGDPSFFGAQLPGHLDVKVQSRNDYNATQAVAPIVGGGSNQHHYTQIDGRTNAPMSLALRLNADLDTTRSGHVVSATQMSAVNLPGAGGGDFASPSFRVRAELRPAYDGDNYLSQLGIVPGIKALLALIDVLDKAQSSSPIYVSPVLPTAVKPGYLDVRLNADPTLPNGSTVSTAQAARTVDAVAGPFGAANEAELRGWKSIHTTGDDFTKADGAVITPQALIRLKDFELGAEAGLSLYGLVSVGIQLTDVLDLTVGLTGSATERVKLKSVLTAISLYAGSSGQARIDANANAALGLRLVVDLLWGLIPLHFPAVHIGSIPQAVDFHSCESQNFLAGVGGHFATSDFNQGAIALAFPDFHQVTGADDALAATGATAVAALTTAITPISCLFHLFEGDADAALVTAAHPAPTYAVAEHPVEGAEVVDAAPADETNPSTQAAQPTPPADLEVKAGQTATACNTLTVGSLIVRAGGRLVVGRQGDPDPADPTHKTCDGSLTIGAEKVLVEFGGFIDGSARRTSLIPLAAGGGGETRGLGGGKGGDRSDIGNNQGGNGGGIRDAEGVAPASDFGAPGGTNGALGVAGGSGGGAIVIAAETNVTINGAVTVNGGAGGAEQNPVNGCFRQAYGGGGAGGISIDALRVKGTGMLSAHGGNGGDGPQSGGGGAGGHIRIRSITSGIPGTSVAAGTAGAAAYSDSDCNEEGDDGDDGDDGLGEIYVRAGFVTLDQSTPGPVQGDDTVNLVVRAIQSGGGPVNVVVCRRDAAPDVVGGIGSVTLDPPEDASSAEAAAAGHCQQVHFNVPNSPNIPGQTQDAYQASLPVTAGDGWHGWYAFAQQTINLDCPPGALSGSCGTQEKMPTRATAVIGVDRSAPHLTHGAPFEANGTPGCPNGSQCLSSPVAILDAPLVDPMSGVHATSCRGNGAPFTSSCGTGSLHTVQLGGGDGEKLVDLQATDRVGNVDVDNLGKMTQADPSGHHLPLARFFLDTRSPELESIALHYPSSSTNGWYRDVPEITVKTRDLAPTAGFAQSAGSPVITAYVDGAGHGCGDDRAGTAATSGQVSVTCDVGASELPSEGIHEIVARSRDRAGNVSAPSETLQMKVDATPPSSRLSLAPEAPDGAAGWYRSRPLFAFATDDNPGGAGVDVDDDAAVDPAGVSRVRFSIDGGAWQTWHPSDEDNRMPEGVHSLCWYATDVAGNPESDVEQPGPTLHPPHCHGQIRVDATLPQSGDGLSPALPDGDNGYHTAKPTIDPAATDIDQANTISGIDRVQMQIDGGAWLPAAKTTLGDGTHEVRTRAFDVAGNESGATTRTVLVDTTPPATRVASFPPAANAHGWFRQRPLVSAVVGDGRDGSGPQRDAVSVDGGAPVSYATPVSILEGQHGLTATPHDRAGLTGATEARGFKVDLTPPTAAPVGPVPLVVFTPPLGKGATLSFTAADGLTPRVRVRVVVYNALLGVVRTLEVPGTGPDGYRPAGAGSVAWDGRGASGKGVLPGVYTYRVQATDQAGNSYLSTESPAFVVALGLL